MNKEEIPIEYYLTKNGEVVKFVRYDELNKYKQVIDKIKEYIKVNMEEYGGDIYLTCKEINDLLEEIE